MIIEFGDNGNCSGIYRIINLINNRIYIGSATLFRKRAADHARQLKAQKHCNQFLQRDYNSCGGESFKFDILELVEDKNQLLIREQFYIDIYFPDKGNCYNLCSIAGSAKGRKLSEETKLKISAGLKGNKNSLGYKHDKYDNAHKHKPCSAETKEKLSKAATGRKHSALAISKMTGRKLTKKHKANISAGLKGNVNNAGNHHSAETKEKMSQAKKSTHPVPTAIQQ